MRAGSGRNYVLRSGKAQQRTRARAVPKSLLELCVPSIMDCTRITLQFSCGAVDPTGAKMVVISISVQDFNRHDFI